jgi:hypothetical protein
MYFSQGADETEAVTPISVTIVAQCETPYFIVDDMSLPRGSTPRQSYLPSEC